MCEECIDSYAKGAPRPDPVPAEMTEAAQHIVWVYRQDWGGVGGPLHVIADDCNLDDYHFEHPILIHEDWAKDLYSDIPKEGQTICERVYALLKPMTEANRAHTISMADEVLYPARDNGAGRPGDAPNVWHFSDFDPDARLELTIERPK